MGIEDFYLTKCLTLQELLINVKLISAFLPRTATKDLTSNLLKDFVLSTALLFSRLKTTKSWVNGLVSAKSTKKANPERLLAAVVLSSVITAKKAKPMMSLLSI